MKRILNLTVLTLTFFVLLGVVSVMAIERPFALNARGIATSGNYCDLESNCFLWL